MSSYEDQPNLAQAAEVIWLADYRSTQPEAEADGVQNLGTPPIVAVVKRLNEYKYGDAKFRQRILEAQVRIWHS